MSARIIDGRAVAARVRAAVAADVREFVATFGRPPGLATVLVGDDSASAVYVGGKQRACAEVGIAARDLRRPADTTEAELCDLLAELNADREVSGVLLQLPLPGGLDGARLASMIEARKDVDGLTPESAGLLALGLPGLRPCTPSGVIELLDSEHAELSGADAVVIGRSNLFGKPMAQLLLGRDATVTICHSRTRDLAATCSRADVLVAAVGRPGMVRADWVKPGAIVIDVGVSRLADGLAGDVDFAGVSEAAGAITPVPGGVGPMTIAYLLRNTVAAARMQV